MGKYVVTGNHFDDEEHRFPLIELADVEIVLEYDDESDYVMTIRKDNGEEIHCDFFNIEE